VIEELVAEAEAGLDVADLLARRGAQNASQLGSTPNPDTTV
jgi:hypothetical protein